MKIVMIHGQNHKGSSYHIGRMIANKIGGEDDVIEFFLPRDLNHFYDTYILHEGICSYEEFY